MPRPRRRSDHRPFTVRGCQNGGVRRALAFVVAALALSACRVDTTVSLTVAADGSGSVAVTVVADADVVAQAPGLADDLRLEDAVAAGWVVDGPTPTEAGGLTLTITHTFATVEEAAALLGSIGGAGGPFHELALTRTDDGSLVTTSLAGTLRVDGGLNAFADPDVLAAVGGTPYADDVTAAGLTPADAVTFTFTAQFPGAPVAAAGTEAGPNPRTWTVPIDATAADLTFSTTSTRGGDGGGVWGTVATVALVALVVWCVLAVAFIAFVAVARRRKAQRRGAARPVARR